MNWLRGVWLSVALGVGVANAAAGESHGATPAGRKLGIGVANILTAWLEIPKSMINTYNQSNLVFGVTGGLAKGLVNTGGRLFTGALDVATFYVPTRPVPQPALVWEDFDAETHYGEAFRLNTD